jgi:hypothetical protein
MIKSTKQSLPAWPLPGPFYIYNENVKELAAAARLRIVDANVMPRNPPFPVAPEADWPVVTLRDEFKPAEPVKPVEIAEPAEPAEQAKPTKAKAKADKQEPAADAVET